VRWTILRPVVNDEWVRSASVIELEGLAACLIEGRIGPGFTGIAAEMAGYAAAGTFLKSVRGIDPKVIAWALRSIARERQEASFIDSRR
jgi:hypothetical protein